jgi:two-component system sensor histidine kinase RpfC
LYTKFNIHKIGGCQSFFGETPSDPIGITMNDTYDKATARGRLSTILSKAIPAWSVRPDSEHEQATIRLIVGFIASAYLFSITAPQHGGLKANIQAEIGVALFFIAASAIVIWLFINPGVNVPRRVFGCIVDNSGATAALFVNGDLAAPVFVVYLWVAFGNGFRYGRRYLLFSMKLLGLRVFQLKWIWPEICRIACCATRTV